MPPEPRSAGYFDGWYADQAAMPAVAEILNRHMGFPPGPRAGVVVAEAIPELAEGLRLRPIQFPGEPASAYDEIRRLLKPGWPGDADLLGATGPQ